MLVRVILVIRGVSSWTVCFNLFKLLIHNTLLLGLHLFWNPDIFYIYMYRLACLAPPDMFFFHVYISAVAYLVMQVGMVLLVSGASPPSHVNRLILYFVICL